jgi:hypothetical protein
MGALQSSIQQDGWIGALTMAANGEIFDGSARLEVGVAAGFDDVIIVESDGSKPIVHKRVDIPTADDPRAKRLGLAANRIAELNLDLDPALIEELSQEVDISGLWTAAELASVLEQAEKKEDLPFLAGLQDRLVTDTPRPSERARIPLSIVLTNADARRWHAYKESIDERDDTTAFLTLLAREGF